MEQSVTYRARAFGNLLHHLYRQHSEWVKDTHPDNRLKLNKEVIETTRFQVVSAGKLLNITESARKGERLVLESNEFLFLKPPRKALLLPVLSFDVDLQRLDSRIQMALFTFDKSDSVAKLVAVGFRFETPERVDSSGTEPLPKNRYHHAQMIRTFDPPELPNVPLWLPDSLPAFPLSAKTPISLFLGVLLALYGLDYLVSDWKDQSFFADLGGDFEVLKDGCGHC